MEYKLKISSENYLFKTIEKLAKSYNERVFLLDSSGFSSAGMNANNTMFAYFKVPKEEFIEFPELVDEDNNEVKKLFMVELNDILIATKGYKGEVEMTIEDNSITFKTNKTLKVTSFEYTESMQMPKVPSTVKATAQTKDLLALLKEVKIFDGSDVVITEGKIAVSGSSNKLQLDMDLDVHTEFNEDLEEPEEGHKISSRFSCDYLNNLFDLPMPTIEVLLAEDMPIQVKYSSDEFMFFGLLAGRGAEE